MKSSSKNIISKPLAAAGDTGQNLVGLLESRLDAFLYRSKLAPTVFAARQIVNHGHVLLNGKRCNIGSVIVKAGDVIQLREKAKQMPSILEGIGSIERDVPEYIEADHDKMNATFLRIPTSGRSALSGTDGTKSGYRILFTVIWAYLSYQNKASLRGLKGAFLILDSSASAFAASVNHDMIAR